jgi:hypothetical protein
MDLIATLIQFLSVQAPWALQVIVVMGMFRLILKPIMVALKAIVDVTPSPKDNELLAQAEGSKAYAILCFVLDYVASIKLPQK